MPQQAQTLREWTGTPESTTPRPPKVIAVTSGKGGGKTNVAANLVVALSELGQRVVVLDADLGLGNLDVLFGVVPRYTIEGFAAVHVAAAPDHGAFMSEPEPGPTDARLHGATRFGILPLIAGRNSMPNRTVGQVEAEIGNALIQFEKDFMGRGPKETRAYVIEDMVLVRLKGVLTPAEQQLAKNNAGTDLIKQIRSNLLEQARELLSGTIEKITGLKVISLYTDISTKTGERVILFTLNENLAERFRPGPA
ncbi:MAG: DUF2294 family protein [Nitrospirae bacterium]|nr:DUF2294 family protein [Nitrospirota bacterium]